MSAAGPEYWGMAPHISFWHPPAPLQTLRAFSAPSRGQCPAPARPLCRLHLCALPPGARSSSWKTRGTGGRHWQTGICGYIPRLWQSTLHTGSYPAEYSWNRAGTFHTVPSGMASAPRETTRRRCWTQ